MLTDFHNHDIVIFFFQQPFEFIPAVSEDDEVAAIVIDNGSGLLKAGFAGDGCTTGCVPHCYRQTKNGDEVTYDFQTPFQTIYSYYVFNQFNSLYRKIKCVHIALIN